MQQQSPTVRKRSCDDLEHRHSSGEVCSVSGSGSLPAGSVPVRRSATVTTGAVELQGSLARLPSTRAHSSSPPDSSPPPKPRRASRESRRAAQTRNSYEEDPWTQVEELQQENARLRAQAQRAEQRQQWYQAELQKAQEGLQCAEDARRAASSEVYALQLRLQTCKCAGLEAPRTSEWTPGSSFTQASALDQANLQVRDSSTSVALAAHSTPYTYGMHTDGPELPDCLSMPMEFLLPLAGFEGL